MFSALKFRHDITDHGCSKFQFGFFFLPHTAVSYTHLMIADIQSTAEMAKVAEQLKYATIVVSSLPLLVMYPFFQKYFDKGIMVGSVKG